MGIETHVQQLADARFGAQNAVLYSRRPRPGSVSTTVKTHVFDFTWAPA
jgi:hypothetical protein